MSDQTVDTTTAHFFPTLDDLQHCGADDILNDPAPVGAYHEAWSRLFAGAQASAEDRPKAAALDLLAKICSMMLEPDDRAAPFKPMMVTASGRTALPDDIPGAEINLLAAVAPLLRNPLLRARLADLVWLKDRRKGVAFAHMAIEAYRQPAIDSTEWDHEVLKCRQRAIQLALSTGKGGMALAGEVVAELVGAFWKALEADNLIAALRYLQPLQTGWLDHDEAAAIAEALEAVARRKLLADDPFGSLRFAESAVVWFGRAQDDVRRAANQILVAESWVAQGEKDGTGITLHHCYTKAIDAYRLVSARYRAQLGAAAAVSQLRAKLPAAGDDMLARMNTFSHSFDITDLVAEAVGKVQGLPPDKALFAFCRIAPWPSLGSLRQEAEIPLSGIAALFPTATVDDDGRVISQLDGIGDAESRERRLAAEMVKACANRAVYSAEALIDPTLDLIRQQFHLSQRDFYAITQMSAVVPGDRADVVAKGLHAGYCGDFVQAIHILVPQFEHMVRMLLKQSGAQTTTRQDGIEMELGLSALVDLPEMALRFDEHLTFTIRSLMCTPIGPNLRNQVAHGLAGANLCASGYGRYTWWLILALVVDGFRKMQQAEDLNNSEREAEA